MKEAVGIKNILLPDIEKLSEKDSTLSTKRYAHLRVINHFIWQSWISLITIIYFRKFDYLNWHLTLIAAFAFGSGALALEFFKNIGKKDESNK